MPADLHFVDLEIEAGIPADESAGSQSQIRFSSSFQDRRSLAGLNFGFNFCR